MKVFVIHISKKGSLEHLIVLADEIHLRTVITAVSKDRTVCTFDSKSVQAFSEFESVKSAKKFVYGCELKRNWVTEALEKYYEDHPDTM